MKYTTATAFRMALEQRLRAMSQQSNIPIMRLRKMIVFDRLMARLLIVAPERWVLKGALALDLRRTSGFRTTKDMDLARQDDEKSATDDFHAAQDLDLNDYFVFFIERTDKLDAALEGTNIRYHVAANLAARRFDDVTVDVGFGDAIVSTAERVQGSDLLGFAGIMPIEIPALPLEQHIAEKLHAYSRKYADHRASSRVKDLIDLVVIQSMREFDSGRLRRALQGTFDSRATHLLPVEIPPPPEDWSQPYRALADETRLDPDLLVGYQRTVLFLGPILSGAVSDNARWSPSLGVWHEH